MKYKIGIFGSSEGNFEKIIEKATELGSELSKYDVILVTGACSGIPYMVVQEASKGKVEIWGFSPEIDLEHQKIFTPKDDISIYKRLIYIPQNFDFVKEPQINKKYRNVISTATVDAGIIISGRWGTMNEFTNLFDMGKIIGVLTDTGGIADELENLSKKITKKSKAKVIYNNSPKNLVRNIIHELQAKV